MEWTNITKRYKNQWVLIDVTKTDKYLKIKEGKVLAHSKDKDEIYKKLLKLRPKKFAIEYTGKIPEDLAVVLHTE